MARIDSMLRLAAAQRASDLHLHSGARPVARYCGDMVELPFRVLDDAETRDLVDEILSDDQRAALARDLEIDFAFDLAGVGRFRGNVFVQNHGLGAVFRVVPLEVPSLAGLGLPPALRELTENANGLVLVTGPTGSGKTTTLAAMVNEINRNSRRHIIMVEDPIEFLHVNDRSVVTQRQVGAHTKGFAAALRSALREAPDVLVVGEMRDMETVNLALSAAETGVLVLGTLHTSSAAKSIDRIIDITPDDSRDQVRNVLAMLLKGVVAQQLCTRASGDGRVAVVEILLGSHAVAHLIRDDKVFQIEGYLSSAEAAGTGVQALDSSILTYVKDGTITLEEGMRVARQPEQLRHLIEVAQGTSPESSSKASSPSNPKISSPSNPRVSSPSIPRVEGRSGSAGGSSAPPRAESPTAPRVASQPTLPRVDWGSK